MQQQEGAQYIMVNLNNEPLISPKKASLHQHNDTTSNFSRNANETQKSSFFQHQKNVTDRLARSKRHSNQMTVTNSNLGVQHHLQQLAQNQQYQFMDIQVNPSVLSTTKGNFFLEGGDLAISLKSGQKDTSTTFPDLRRTSRAGVNQDLIEETADASGLIPKGKPGQLLRHADPELQKAAL